MAEEPQKVWCGPALLQPRLPSHGLHRLRSCNGNIGTTNENSNPNAYRTPPPAPPTKQRLICGRVQQKCSNAGMGDASVPLLRCMAWGWEGAPQTRDRAHLVMTVFTSLSTCLMAMIFGGPRFIGDGTFLRSQPQAGATAATGQACGAGFVFQRGLGEGLALRPRGRFRPARAQSQYIVYPGNTPENPPPTEACMIHSKQHAVQNSGPWDPWQASHQKNSPWCTSRGCRVQNSGPMATGGGQKPTFRRAHSAPPPPPPPPTERKS